MLHFFRFFILYSLCSLIISDIYYNHQRNCSLVISFAKVAEIFYISKSFGNNLPNLAILHLANCILKKWMWSGLVLVARILVLNILYYYIIYILYNNIIYSIELFRKVWWSTKNRNARCKMQEIVSTKIRVNVNLVSIRICLLRLKWEFTPCKPWLYYV